MFRQIPPNFIRSGVMPFMLSAENGTGFSDDGWRWVEYTGGEASFTLEFNATRKLRCGLGIGGPC